MSYTICNVYSLPSTYAASSLRAQLYDSANNAVGDEISAGFYKRTGSSTIFAHTLTVPDTHVGWCDVYVAGAPSVIIACIPINPQEIENANIKTSTRGTSTLTTSDIDNRLAAYDAPTKAELDTAQAAIIDALPTAAEIDTQLSGTHGNGSWATATGFATPTNVSDAQSTIIDAIPTPAEIDAELSDNHGDGSWEDTGAGLTAAQVWSYATRTLTALGSAAGVEFTYTVTDSATTNPIADVSVWFSTNSGITNVVWYGSTDAFGVARDANGNKPRLDSGTYYMLCRKSGFSFTVDTETVS